MTGASHRVEDVLDLVVLGGGVMGLFTAYHASTGSARVAVLEHDRIGDPATASFGRTRSFRKDDLDPVSVRLADEAIELWTEFERRTATDVLVGCGCMNIASRSVTADLAATYAQLSTETLQRLGMAPEALDSEQIGARFPYLRADIAYLDGSGGLVDVTSATRTLLRILDERDVPIYEQVGTSAIVTEGDLVRVHTDAGEFLTRALVITAGHGTNDLLALLAGCDLRIPISRDRPSEAKYFVPPADARHQFTSEVMPVIAYLDTGVYLHPIVEGVIDAVKIGYYNPPDIARLPTGARDIADFVSQCLPGLADAKVNDVLDVDQCDYDLVGDDDFVLGPVPGFDNVFVGVGWRGTGYKFAPWVGRVLGQLALRGGSVYAINRFDPSRFAADASPGATMPS